MTEKNDEMNTRMDTQADAIGAATASTTRMARCAYYGGRKALGAYSSSSCKAGRDGTICRCEEPSSKELAFFEFQGAGSRVAALCRHCGMTESAHKGAPCSKGLRSHKAGTAYEPQGDLGFDKFYCGCHGWD
jgi:hypothetical protein